MKLAVVSSLISLANIAYAAKIVLNKDASEFFVDGQVAELGYNLDVNERRLVQLHPGQQPVWMTEGEKVPFYLARLQTAHDGSRVGLLRTRSKQKQMASTSWTCECS